MATAHRRGHWTAVVSVDNANDADPRVVNGQRSLPAQPYVCHEKGTSGGMMLFTCVSGLSGLRGLTTY